MVKKHLQAKSKHHHVWADYLRRWSSNDRDVYYTTAKGNIVCGSVKGLTMEKNFYQVKKLSDAHIEVIKAFSSKASKSSRRQHMFYLNVFLRRQELEEIYNKRDKKDKEVERTLHANKCNVLEDLHSEHENEVQEIISSLTNRDLAVLTDPKNFKLFIEFFGHQILRTKTSKDTVLAGLSKDTVFPGFSRTDNSLYNVLNECWWFLSYMLGMNIGEELYLSRKEDKHCLLVNDTSIPFITSDQPIINVHKLLNYEKIEPPNDEHYDFYYPISPKVAYMINRSDRFHRGLNNVSIDIVKELNVEIACRANVNIISNCENTLKELLKNISFHLNFIKSHSKQ